MDTKELPELGKEQLAAIQQMGEEHWGDVLAELEKTVDPKVLDIIKVVAGHLYTGGYMTGAESMHAAIRGIK